jgi:hypothetical protein
VDISQFDLVFIPLLQIYRVYNPLGFSLLIVSKMALGGKAHLTHRKQQGYQHVILSFQHLFEDVVVVIDLGVFFA